MLSKSLASQALFLLLSPTSLAPPALIFMLLTTSLVLPALLLLLLTAPLLPPVLLLTASLAPPGLFLLSSNTVAPVFNSLSAPNPLASVGNSLIDLWNTVFLVVKVPRPSSTDSHVVNNLPGPSSTIMPVVNSLSGPSSNQPLWPHPTLVTASLAPPGLFLFSSTIIYHVVNSLAGLSNYVVLAVDNFSGSSNTGAPVVISLSAPQLCCSCCYQPLPPPP